IPGRDADGKIVAYHQMTRLLERLVVPQNLTLKVGAQVMLVKNLEQGSLVNGSVGTVESFITSREARKTGISVGRIDSGHNQSSKDDGENESDASKGRVWPVVRFTNGRTILCIPLEFSVNSPSGIMEARRDQVRPCRMYAHCAACLRVSFIACL
ncbi:hypothetical protein BDP27DRAFT_1228094, partial [Rhodocollybia butyracea]